MLDDTIEVSEDVMLGHAENMPAELVERAVPRGIMTLAAFVVGAIDLDDEPDLCACEVDDVRPDDELPTESEACLGPGQRTPEPLLGARGGEAHGASALFEELRTVRRDEPTSKHSHLVEADADARRAKARRAASVPRGALTPAKLSRAARKVRAPELGAWARRPRSGGFAERSAARGLCATAPPSGDGHLPHPRAGARGAPSTDQGEAERRRREGRGLHIDTSTTPNAETAYTYDPQGNLRGVTRPAPLAAIEYVIDGENRRVGKKVGGALVQGFLYDGARIVAELDGTGAVVSRFVYVTGGHSPDVMITSAGTFRLVKDHLGSARLVVNAATGAVAQRLDYDEWGVVTNDTSPGFQPFGFAGGLWDRDTNLVRFGARDYDPTTGRWTTKDRSRFRGGLNLYAYANVDPINFVDTTGRTPTVALGPAIAGGAAAGAIAGPLGVGIGAGLAGLGCALGVFCSTEPPGPPAPPPAPGSGGGPGTAAPAEDTGPTDSAGGIAACIPDDEDPEDDCKRKASDWELAAAGIDAHQTKKEIVGKRGGHFDICKCDSGGFALKRLGCRGPIIERL